MEATRRELFTIMGGMAAYAATASAAPGQETAAKKATGFLQFGSRRIAYRDYGGNGPNLLALHGTFSRSATFEPLAAALSGTCRVVTIDQRGHGLSDRAPDYSRAGYVADAEAAIERLGLAPAIVLGHSLGGINAYQLAARRPDLVRALVIEDIGAVVTSDFSFLAAWPRRFPTFRALHAFLRQNMNAIDYFLESAHEFDDGWGFRWEADDMIATAREASGDWWRDWLGSSCPALLIHGHKSFALTTEHAREVAARRPNTKLVEAPHCGHTPHDEDPELFNRTVREFVQSLKNV